MPGITAILCYSIIYNTVPNPFIEAKFLSSSRFRVALFNGLLTENSSDRAIALDNIANVVGSWAHSIFDSKAESKLGIENGNGHTNGISHHPTLQIIDSPWSMSTEGAVDESSEQDAEELETKALLQLHVLTILRLSLNCPYKDVRHFLRKFLKELKQIGVPIPKPIHSSPSYFISKEDLPTFDELIFRASNQQLKRHSSASYFSSASSFSPSSFQSSSPSGQSSSSHLLQLMKECFNSSGRFSHMYRIMGYFPTYLEKFRRVQRAVIRGMSGPLPRTWRYYIAIMAASQHSCQYLVSLLRSEYFQANGEPSWFQGLGFAPQKLQNLATINTILAHQPWLLKPEHIECLVRGDSCCDNGANGSPTSSGNSSENWTMSELVQAIVIMSIFHSLSSFALGCGLIPEIDTLGGVTFDEETNPEEESPTELEHHQNGSLSVTDDIDGVAKAVAEIKITGEEEPAELMFTTQLISKLQRTQSGQEEVEIEVSEGERKEEFEKCEILDSVSPLPEIDYPFETQLHSYPPVFEPLNRFRLDNSQELSYQDFNVKSSTYSVFRLTDWSWEEHGVGLVSKYLANEVGEMIDEEFDEVRCMTDYSLAATTPSPEFPPLDTAPFRTAIWYYVLRLFGQSHDDYQYSLVNHYLNKKVKNYIKKVATVPETVNYSDFSRMGVVLRPEEKCHVNLLVVEARRQAELVYALSAVTKFLEKR
ncbi:PA26 p53-induced protein-domain-containing protein [Paraphysoderma sedebokerense]|nr:PA26 p53-induced protein-domain-containing protein [Paraphysoderma sedebokerense]